MTQTPVYRITARYALGAPEAIKQHHAVGVELLKRYLTEMQWRRVIKVEIEVQGS
ncbi:MAG TPA: hypothetical protein VFQ48_05705 [Pseudonocardiaceae bacterium]|nr:hypothetical protein [Pseudonocardiaceae bacterium]